VPRHISQSTFYVLIDTCVWIDAAKDQQQQAILAALEELVREGDIALTVAIACISRWLKQYVDTP
jgi:uncharacterized protein YbgA (DUF1722 family)